MKDIFQVQQSAYSDHNTAGIRLEFSGKTILSGNETDLLGVTIDTKLSFDSHITKICRKASRQPKLHERHLSSPAVCIFYQKTLQHKSAQSKPNNIRHQKYSV